MVSAPYRPEHTGLFAARTDHGLATGFDDSRTDEQALFAEATVLHPGHIAHEIAQLLPHDFRSPHRRRFLAGFGNQRADAISQQAFGPALPAALVLRMVLTAPKRLQHKAGVDQSVVE